MKKNFRLIYNDAALEQKISNIQKTVKLHMNGTTAHAMQEMGLKYDHNYGVSIPELRSVARTITPDKNLAIRLWQINIREMKILGTLLFPATQLDREKAEVWQDECDNIELTEQAVMNLFQHWPEAVDFSLDCLQSDNKNKLIFGLLLAQRTYGRFNAEQTEKLIDKIIDIINRSTDMLVARYTGTALAAFCHKNREVALRLKKLAYQLDDSEKHYQQIIKQLIEQEIEFLGPN